MVASLAMAGALVLLAACSDDDPEQAATTTVPTTAPPSTVPPPTPACATEEVVVVIGPEADEGTTATTPLVVQNASPQRCTVPPFVGLRFGDPTRPDQFVIADWQSPPDGGPLPEDLELEPCATASSLLGYATRADASGTTEGLAFSQALVAVTATELPKPVLVTGGPVHVLGPMVEPALVVDQGAPPTAVPACAVPVPPQTGEIL